MRMSSFLSRTVGSVSACLALSFAPGCKTFNPEEAHTSSQENIKNGVRLEIGIDDGEFEGENVSEILTSTRICLRRIVLHNLPSKELKPVNTLYSATATSSVSLEFRRNQPSSVSDILVGAEPDGIDDVVEGMQIVERINFATSYVCHITHTIYRDADDSIQCRVDYESTIPNECAGFATCERAEELLGQIYDACVSPPSGFQNIIDSYGAK